MKKMGEICQPVKRAHWAGAPPLSLVVAPLALLLALLFFADAPPLAAAASAPTVSNEAVASVTASTAIVHAAIDPNGLSSAFHAEYVSEAQFQAHEWAEATKVPSSDAELPASESPISVSEELGGLQPNSSYHFRFVAANVLGTMPGSGATLTTPVAAASASTLPDNRVDELVSTSGSQGEPFAPPTPFGWESTGIFELGTQPIQVAVDGDALAYVGEPSFLTGNGVNNNNQGNEWLARRTPAGWSTEDITPIATNSSAIYQGFSNDLTTAVFQGWEYAAPLTPGVRSGCGALYSRANASGQFRALFTENEIHNPTECGKPFFAGASEGYSQVIFQSEAALTANAQEASEVPPGHSEGHGQEDSLGAPCMFGCNLYDQAGRHLTLVNVLEGHDVPSATFGGYAGEHQATDFSNAISADGSRIFWTDTQKGPEMEHIYVLENGSTTVQVSGAGPAEYWTATPDGHYAYYTEGGGLWRFDTRANTRKELAGSGFGVQGVIGSSEDGSYLYFVANGALAPGATHKTCAEEEVEEEIVEEEAEAVCLYVLHEGTLSFIAALSPGEETSSHTVKAGDNFMEGGGVTNHNSYGDWKAYLGRRLAEVTPDGRHLVFESRQPLTGYRARQIEVFVYSTEAAGLACASCDPLGAPPEVDEGERTKLTAGYGNATSLPRWISDDGNRVFFQSSDPLVPQDTNDEQDVYEWEREGVGTCSVQAPSRLDGGCVFLLSGGLSGSPSFLVGADATGENVFFEHVGPLGRVEAGVDRNELYDVRVNGGFPHPSLACSGTGCQGVPPGAPSFATPASVTFTGAGNLPPAGETSGPKRKTVAQTRSRRLAASLKACRKGRARARRANCERRARARYAAKKSTTAKKVQRAARVGNERRAGA